MSDSSPVYNQDNKDDAANLAKRKKQLTNMKGGQIKKSKRPKYEWTESPDDLTLSLKVEGVKSDQIKHIDVQFADNDVTIKLPDGRVWTWIFCEEIFKEQSRVKVKKTKMTLHMKKKKQKLWETLEPEPVEPESVPDELEERKDPDEPEIVTSAAVVEESPDVQTPKTEEENAQEKMTEEKPEKEELKDELIVEEPLKELQHIKHDYIEKDDTFVVHIYVKGVKKDNLEVKFEENLFSVKFQTSNADFLKLHTYATSEMKFSWKVKLSGEVVKDKCTYKLSNYFIELFLMKKQIGRWNQLEALQRKVDQSVPSSDSWQSINKVSVESGSPKLPGSSKVSNTEDKENVMKKVVDDDFSNVKTKEQSQKPTAKVQPLNKQVEQQEQIVKPGFTGLDNLGNTCFMNGVLQCLANTRAFRDFFIEGDFQSDLNTENVLGSGGKLAVAFAVLMKVLWSGKHYSYQPAKLKNLVAQKASQFTGFAQHDAQEFLAFLLDGLHEDLNRIRKKPYTETVEDHGRPDDVVANVAWAVHKKRNDSFIVDHFQGQYKSKLVCPKCGKVSITFDPFLYLSLPLPRKQRLLPVTVMWKDPFRKPVKYMLRLPKESTVEVLKDVLAKKTGISPKNIRVFEAYKGRIHKMFGRGSNLSHLQANDVIIACEVLSEEVAGEPVCEVAVVQRTLIPNQFPTRCHSCKKLCPEGAKLKRCTRCFKVGYCDQACQKTHWQYHKSQCNITPEPVGTPFVISLPESRATFSRLCTLMEGYARFSVDVFQPPVKIEVPKEPRLSSRLSSSNLSSSSQSSGSLNSLDSQSSFSSSCTITADQEQNIDDTDMIPDGDGRLSRQQESPVDTSCLSQAGTCVSTDSGYQSAIRSVSQSSSSVEKDHEFKMGGEGDGLHGDKNINVLEARKSLVAPCQEPNCDKVTSSVKPVLGVPSIESERSTPMFYIKPVNNEGYDLPGADGEKLDDKGDTPLDLTNRLFFSLDWKNNDKLPGYALVQSKEMESENDSSMMTASLEESNNVTLQQCIELFTEPEILAPEEAWYCPQCKEHREATKQLSTWRLPHTLIIQLKRFSFRNFIWRDKIDKMVEFPTRGLDLSAYYLGSRPDSERPPLYDLYGVVNHHGGILGGHYTAYVRCSDKLNSLANEVEWRLCDDSRVSVISHEKNVVTRAAYLLFYQRREVIIPPPSAGLPSEITRSAEEEDEDDENDFESVNSETSPQSDFSEAGELIIDASPGEVVLELLDLEESSGDNRNDSRGTNEVPIIILDDERDKDLGYTDMDSVD